MCYRGYRRLGTMSRLRERSPRRRSRWTGSGSVVADCADNDSAESLRVLPAEAGALLGIVVGRVVFQFGQLPHPLPFIIQDAQSELLLPAPDRFLGLGWGLPDHPAVRGGEP